MKKIFQPLTLANIGKLMDKKLLPIQRQLTNLLGETTYTRTYVERLRSEVNQGFDRVDERFDKVEDQIKSLDQRMIVQSERIRKVEKPIFTGV